MRRFLIVLVALLCGAVPLWAARKDFQWSMDRIVIRGGEDSVRVSVAWTFKDWNVREGSAMVFLVSLKGRGGQFVLRPVTVYGRKAARSAGELVASGRSDEHAVTDLSQPRQFVFEESFPMQPGMDTLKVLFQLSEWTRSSGLAVRSASTRATFARPPMPAGFSFYWDVEMPMYAAATYRSYSFSFPALFEGSGEKYDPDYCGNAEAVDAVLPLLKGFFSSKKIKMKSASLSLYVPPQASVRESVALSRKRVASLYGYLQRRGVFTSAGAEKVGAGEDWKGVRAWAGEGPYGADARLMEILSWEEPQADRLGAVRREKPAVWEAMERECLPRLGRAEVSVFFRAPVFKNARQIIPYYEELPECLSESDFYLLLFNYEKGSAEWLDALLCGASLHPSCMELCFDAAMALMDGGHLNRAAEFLRRCGDGKLGLYARARWLYLNGRYSECADALSAALEMGLPAGSDLDAYKMYRDQEEKAAAFIQWVAGSSPWKKVNL